MINQDAENIARDFQERARMERVSIKQVVHQVPSLKDPKLFAVKCYIGSEKEMALSLGNKYRALKGTAQEINIISVNALDKIKGCVYIEAFNKFNAEVACKGMNKLDSRFIKVRITRLYIPKKSGKSSNRILETVRALKSGNLSEYKEEPTAAT